jgi:hypothetical protein
LLAILVLGDWCTQGASESFVDAISQAAYMEFVFPDSWLLNAGERSSHLYCIISGTVEVLNKDGLRLWGICEGATIGDETALCDFPMVPPPFSPLVLFFLQRSTADV